MPHQCVSCESIFEDGSKEMLAGCPDCGGNTFQYFQDEPDPEASPPDRPDHGGGVADTVGQAATTLRDAVAARDGESDEGDAGFAASAPFDAGGDPANHRRDAEFVDEGSDSTAAASEEAAGQATARSEMVGPDELPAESPDLASGTARRSDDASAPTDATEAAASTDGGEAAGTAPGQSSREQTSPDGPTDPPSPDASTKQPSPADDQQPEPAESPAAGSPESPAADSPDLSTLRQELNEQFEGIRVLEPGHYEINPVELFEREETIIALREDGRYVIEVPESLHGD